MATLRSIPLWQVFTRSALVALDRGDLESAEKHYRSAVERAKAAYGVTNVEYAEALMNVADFLTASEQYFEAESFYRKALNSYKQIFGHNSRPVSIIYKLLAALNRQRHNLAMADVLEKRSVDILRSVIIDLAS